MGRKNIRSKKRRREYWKSSINKLSKLELKCYIRIKLGELGSFKSRKLVGIGIKLIELVSFKSRKLVGIGIKWVN